ncbi:MAG TPA: response regulator [Thermoanaerobaculia bacterium]|nr:response regulator [Thermoanaerobaculia bacterium]
MSANEPIRILVIDDDPGVRGLLTILFEREGWAVTTAADGEVALEQIARVRPDVVVLDLMLPKRTGLEVIRQIAEQDDGTAEKVLVLTAISEAQLRRLPVDLHVRKLMRKPFDNAELLQSVKACGSRVDARAGMRSARR